ncbi:uncharacterized protein VTP21DRAFT_5878 [Calcarisporiella thermophila]|uniref:uncharacterized protein n=1 Tax=Calcarisporiella thermophila TaxID=911321 RepID=UPI0037420DAA
MPAASNRVSTSLEQTSSGSIPEAFVFDDQKFNAIDTQEKQELFLLQWLSNLERELRNIAQDVLKNNQGTLEKQFIRLISLSTAKPQRPIRRIIARCYSLLYTRGDSRSLFDTITAFQGIVNAGKGIGDKEIKLAAVHCIGVLTEDHGSKFLSLFGESAATFLRILRTASVPLIFRVETFNSLAMVLRGAGKAANDAILKDVIKVIKANLTDKALIIRVASAECLQTLINFTSQSVTTKELEELLSLLCRACENSNFDVRRTVASTIAALLIATESPIDSKRGADSPPQPPDEKASNGRTVKLSVQEMLGHLSSHYNNKASVREIRTAVIEAYALLFMRLGTHVVETNYATLVAHIMQEIVSHPRNTQTRYEALSARAHGAFLLREVLGRLLSEQGQIAAVRVLVMNCVKRWPALMPTETAPTKWALVAALNEIAALLFELGEAASTLSDVIVEPLLTVASHPNYSVQVAAAMSFRNLCLAIPTQLSTLISRLLAMLQKDIGNLTNPAATPELFRRCIGYAHSLASLVCVIPFRPLEVSFDLGGRVFGFASTLLKTTTADSHINSVQSQVAWTLMTALLSLGPNFARIHLPQLLLYWKAALPKPPSKEAVQTRTEQEWIHIVHQRSCTVGAILSLLEHCSDLVTRDTAKRIVALLNNVLGLLAVLPTSFATTAVATPPTPQMFTLTLPELEYIIRARVFRCLLLLRPAHAFESLHAGLLRSSMMMFAEPERPPGSAFSHSLTQAVPGTYTPIWIASDGYGYGVSSKVRGFHIDVGGREMARGGDENVRAKDWMCQDALRRVETQFEQPILEALEYDFLPVCTTPFSEATPLRLDSMQSPPPATALIDVAIEIFAMLLPIQPSQSQESMLEHLLTMWKSPKLDRAPGRKVAVQVNVSLALLGAMKRVRVGARRGEVQPAVESARVQSLMQSIIQEAIVSPDPYVRNVASEAMGMLTSVASYRLVTNEIQILVDQVVNNREPDARAGSALSLGSIYNHVGSMAASAHLKTIVSILLSLSSDPHPVVHIWALDGLATLIEAAGLMFSSFVNSTLGLVAKLFMKETHECGATVSTSNAGLNVGFSVYQELGRILYALINTAGPELQMSSRLRELCLTLVEELLHDPDTRVQVEGVYCIQHLIMFIPRHLDMQYIVRYLQKRLSSPHRPLRAAAVTCLYQLVQRDVHAVFAVARPGLDAQLFTMLDTDPYLDDVKNVIRGWLKQTALTTPSVWIGLCKSMMSHGADDRTASVAPSGAVREEQGRDENGIEKDDGNQMNDEDDDEASGIRQVGASAGTPAKSGTGEQIVKISPRWRTQLFALQCVHQVVRIIASSGDKRHIDLESARAESNAESLVLHISDLIKMAFAAATSSQREMRLEGISLLRDLIEVFSPAEDPDLEGALLLEQYQAQIAAALTPAFEPESPPDVLAAAVEVCAVYVASGIVQELDRLGRVLKLLVTALEKCRDGGARSQDQLSLHASVMTRLAMLRAWAELYVASSKQTYLVDVVAPHLSTLCSLWVLELKRCVLVRLEMGEIPGLEGIVETRTNANSNDAFDSIYSRMSQKVVLPFYRTSWANMLSAVTRLLEVNDPSISALLQLDEGTASKEGQNTIVILFGLCIETLSVGSEGTTTTAETSPADPNLIITGLDALKTLLSQRFAGALFSKPQVFLETCNVLDRLVKTQGPQAQILIVKLVERVILEYDADLLASDFLSSSLAEVDTTPAGDPTEAANEDLEASSGERSMLEHLMRLLINIICQCMPALGSRRVVAKQSPLEDRSVLLVESTDALLKIAQAAPSLLKPDILAVTLYICTAILQDSDYQANVTSHMLISLKTLFEHLDAQISEETEDAVTKVLGAFIGAILDRTAIQEHKSDLVKTAMLSSTLLFTSVPRCMLHDNSCQQQYVEFIHAALQSQNPEIALAAIQCVQNLFQLPARKSSSLASVTLGRRLTRAVLPNLIVLLLSFKDKESALFNSQIAEKSIKTILSLSSIVEIEKQSDVLCLILQVLSHLLSEPETAPTALHNIVIEDILNLVSELPVAFKAAVSQLPTDSRTRLESAVRQRILTQQQESRRAQGALETRAPTIELKSNFANFA